MSSSTLDAQSFLNKAGWNAAGSIIAVVGRLAALIAVGRMLGAVLSGKFGVLFWMLEMVNVVCALGLRLSIARYTSEMLSLKGSEAAQAFARRAMAAYSILTGISIVPLLFWLNREPVVQEHPGLLAALVCAHIFRSLEYAGMASLGGLHRFKAISHFNLVSALILLSVILPFMHFWGIVGAVAAFALASAPLGFFALLQVFLGIPAEAIRVEREISARFFKFAFFAWITAMLDAIIWSRSELFFLNRYASDPAQVGYFSNSLYFANTIAMIPTLVTSVFLTEFSALSASGNQSGLARVYSLGTRVMALAVIPCACGLTGILPVLMPALLGEEYRPAVPVAMGLCFLMTLQYNAILAALLYGLDRSWFFASCGFVGATMMCALSVWIIPRWGAPGAVWVRSIVQVAMIALGMTYVLRVERIAIPFAAIAKTYLAGIVCGLSAWTLLRILPAPGMVAAAIPLGVVVYCATVKKMNLVGDQEAQILLRMTAKLPGSLRKPFTKGLAWIAAKPAAAAAGGAV